jgi:hypothetical protein
MGYGRSAIVPHGENRDPRTVPPRSTIACRASPTPAAAWSELRRGLPDGLDFMAAEIGSVRGQRA